MNRRPVRSALAVAVCCAVGSTASHAQPETRTLERVEVVGSRIKRTDLETSQPVFVIEREDIARTGLVAVGDILQRITTHGASLNTLFNNGGNGETRIDLRNLGSNRTLVLVNGRRWSTTLDGAVDLSSIPLSIVERIEVLKDGASALYGSDAIAGVVNITTRDDYAGAEASAYLGENEEGDGRVEAYDFTVGAAGERASVVLNASYNKQEPIFAGDREISAVPVFGVPATDLRFGASGSTPFGRFGFGPGGTCAYRPSGNYPAAPSRCPVDAFGFREATTFDPVSGAYRNFQPMSDGHNFAPENYLQTPQERTALFVQGRYGLTESVSFETELLYNERRSDQLLAPIPIMVAGNSIGPSRIVVPADHVHNPFGQPVFSMQIRPGGQNRRFLQDADTFRAGAGLDGVFELFGRTFAFDVNAIYTDTSVLDQASGQVNGARLGTSLGPSFRDAGGVARCGAPGAVIEGCVPFDPFRGPDAFTPEMLAYLYFTAQETNARELTDYSANVTGDLLDLPAGPLAFAAGYEYRRESGVQVKDAQLQAGNVSSGSVGERGFAGGSSVDEAYGELAIPLLADQPLARVLEVSVAGRWSKYSSFGETNNFKAGFRWKPHDDLLVRGNWSEAFRAPSIFELFDPVVIAPAPPGNFDPCASTQAPNAQARAGCEADGVPGGVYTPSFDVTIISSGGNTSLEPETATTRTLGFVWTPSWIDGLDILVDWFEVEIDNSIRFVDPERLLDICTFEQAPSACAQTTRDPGTGELTRLDARNFNAAFERVEGYDFTVAYRFETAWGRWAVDWDSVYYVEHVLEVPVGTRPVSLPGNYAVREPGWRIRSNLGLEWQRGDFGASLAARYYDALDEKCELPPEFLALCSSPDIESPAFNGARENEIEDRWYFDLQGSWNAPWNAELRTGIQNVFDEDPPISYSTFANSFDPQYPVPGRFWYVSYTQRF